MLTIHFFNPLGPLVLMYVHTYHWHLLGGSLYSTYVRLPALIPIGFLDCNVICGDANMCIADAKLYHFGILTSTMHNAWVRYTCGRLKSDFRYSASIVYNNFPWPLEPSDKHRASVEAGAEAVLDARASHPGASLAALYDPNTMPANLVQAHRSLDRTVDAAYLAKLPPQLATKPKLASEAQRVAFLFELHLHLSSLFDVAGDSLAPLGRGLG